VIPASYLYRDIYARTWGGAPDAQPRPFEVAPDPEGHHPIGLLQRLAALSSLVLHRLRPLRHGAAMDPQRNTPMNRTARG